MPAAASRLPAVVFLHGLGGSAAVWAPQLAAFAEAGLAPVALDLLGYGARPPVRVLQFEALAADVEAAIAERRLERPVLIGHSLGGMVAQTALRRRPKGYAAAVLLATSPAFGSPDGEFQKKFVADRLAPLDRGQSLAQLAPGIVDQIIAPGAPAAARALAIAAMSAVHPDTYRAAVSCLVEFDERANLAAIRIPVLCLAGALDRTAPPAVLERMASRVPGAHYQCLAGVGHLANVESPAAFNAAALDFLRRTLHPLPP